MNDYAELMQQKLDVRRAQLEKKIQQEENKNEETKAEQNIDLSLSPRELQLALDAIQSKVYNRVIYDLNNETANYNKSKKQIILPPFSVCDFDSFNIYDYTKKGDPLFHITYDENISVVKVDCWVYDKQEEIADKFKNIYSAFAGRGDTIAIIIKRTMKGCQFYFAIRSNDHDKVNSARKAFTSSVSGNFPGTKLQTEKYPKDLFGIKNAEAVTIVTGVGSEKSEKGISQGIEKLLNGITPNDEVEEYTIVYLAESVNKDDLQKIRNGYETMASAIFPYSEYQESEGTSKGQTEGTNSSISLMKGVNRAIAKTNGTSLAINFSGNSSQTDSEGHQSGTSETVSTNESEQHGTNEGIQTSQSEQSTINESNTVNVSKGNTYTEGSSNTTTHTSSISDAHSDGKSISAGTSVSVGTSATVGVSAGVPGVASASASVTSSVSVSANVNTGRNTSDTHTTGFSDSFADSLSQSTAVSETESLGKTLGTAISKGISTAKTSAISYATSIAKGIAVATTNTVIRSVANTVGVSAGGSMGFQRSVTKTQGTSSSRTETNGINYCVSDNVTTNTTRNVKAYPVVETIKKIEKQIERVGQFEALGAWKNAIYVFGSGQQTYNVANFLKGLLQGNESFVENFVVNRWEKKTNFNDVDNIKRYVSHLMHPIMYRTLDMYSMMADKNIPLTNVEGTMNQRHLGDMFLNINSDDIEIVTPTTFISSAELAQTMSFPYKSVQGLSSISCVEFGRNIIYKNELTGYKNTNKVNKRKIAVGKVNFMNSVEQKSVIELDVDSLSKHTFITGSTGSGKSTAVYTMLHRLREQGVKFLVVEPAKGEYKYEFKDKNVTIYNTNGRKGKILRINPFSFPTSEIMVYEHIDRLIEIFNVCWPMYAAMPAVLKESVELAYKSAGWDLKKSINPNGNVFPTFVDVLIKLKEVIDRSAFSQEVKSNYVGSLVTRIKSLTNGIYGQIFTCNSLNDDELFDSNVIVDLSRIGSVETKSMIMGLLIMKMQEYYMDKYSGKVNQPLHHITVLEEAHNILKRVSTEQTSEGSNLVGKSVEMIANAIAEMRTYGEGFIIADQSPSLMDMSVIRNTNTKLIFNLPDQTDRELTGYAMGLNEDQIGYLSKLSTGVCALYQNEWVEATLCSFDKYSPDVKPLDVRVDRIDPVIMNNNDDTIKAMIRLFRNCYNPVEKILTPETIKKLDISAEIKIDIIKKLSLNDSYTQEEMAVSIEKLFYNDKVSQIFMFTERKLSLASFGFESEDDALNRAKYYLNLWKTELEIPYDNNKAGECVWLLIVSALLNAHKNNGNSIKNCSWMLKDMEKVVYNYV